MRWFEPLLYPLAVLYGAATNLRNHLFDIGLKKSINFTVPTIAVGNLQVGGTGKTPMVEFIIHSLAKEYKITVLSRGYGRKTRGFHWANSSSNAAEIGDEPLQIYSKYAPNINVAVGEDRVLAVPEILIQGPETELIVLDDAFQHRYLKADAYIMLTTYQQPFFEDKILPLGRLRENPKGAERADVIIVTKCPQNVSDKEKDQYIRKVRAFSGENISILFSSLTYGTPLEISNTGKKPKDQAILLSGLANSSDFVKKVSEEYEVVGNFEFRDHHSYTLNDLKVVKNHYDKFPNSVILTTEKDAVKMRNPLFETFRNEIPIFSLPIEVKFNETDQKFLINFMHHLVEKKAYTREI